MISLTAPTATALVPKRKEISVFVIFFLGLFSYWRLRGTVNGGRLSFFCISSKLRVMLRISFFDIFRRLVNFNCKVISCLFNFVTENDSTFSD